MGYYRAGFDVVGVDINPQPNYPFLFVQWDALYYLEEVVLPFDGHGFDAIHASPPCQRYTMLSRGTNDNEADHPDLLPPARDLLDQTGMPYVIENVMGAPMRRDLMLCGLQFGLKVFRHRQFELGGWEAEPLEHTSHKGHRVAGWRDGVKHEGDMFAVYGDGGGKGSVMDWQDAMGIDWTDVKKEIAEAIPPAYTEYIGTRLLQHLTSNREVA
jgi:DNA (cytosine-5)-methyltransferase 1